MEGLDLFNGLKKGDSKSIESIYDIYLPKLKSWIKQNNGSEDDAYDIFQETLETILLKIHNVKSSFGGLLMQVAKNKWIDRIRKNKTADKVRNDYVQRLEPETNSEASFLDKEKDYVKFKLLEKSFEQLSSLCQQLMTMIKEGKKVEEIVVSLSFNNANSLYRRKAACMDRWSKLLKSQNEFNSYFG